MFETTPVESLLADVRASDFADEPVLRAGHHRIDAIVALDRLIRAAQAEQAGQFGAMHAERSSVMRLGEGDPTLSVRPAPRSASRWGWAGCRGCPTGHLR